LVRCLAIETIGTGPSTNHVLRLARQTTRLTLTPVGMKAFQLAIARVRRIGRWARHGHSQRTAEIGDNDREKIGRDNAKRLFRLS
jgi:hypothetical protein